MELNERIKKLESHPACSEHCGEYKRLALVAAYIWREADRLVGFSVPSLNVDTGALVEHAGEFYKAAWKRFEDLPSHQQLFRPQRPG
jgi:hypothetical protein